MNMEHFRIGWLAAAIASLMVATGCVRVVEAQRPQAGVATQASLRTNGDESQRARSVIRIGMTVGDLERSIRFYQEVLGFTLTAEDEQAGESVERLTGVFGARVRKAFMRLGAEEIELSAFLAPEGRPIPVDSRSNDRWFQHIAIAVSDMDRAYARLRAHKVRFASTGPQTLPAYLKNAAGISAFYFKDPDGHVLEVIHFPSGKGEPRWAGMKDSEQIFLGIDHTAIAVADTEESLKFYRDVLGLRLAGGSENFGTEQEHLNNVQGARLRITTLRANSGPGVELLEYLSPRDGRAYPADSRANDLWHWQTTVEVGSLERISQGVGGAGARWVSTGVVQSADGTSARMIRDPDGHAVIVTQK